MVVLRVRREHNSLLLTIAGGIHKLKKKKKPKKRGSWEVTKHRTKIHCLKSPAAEADSSLL